MSEPTILTKSDLESLIREYLSGSTFPVLTKKYKIGQARLTKIIKESIGKTRNLSENAELRWTKEIPNIIHKFCVLKFSTQLIAEEYGVNKKTIIELLKKNNIEIIQSNILKKSQTQVIQQFCEENLTVKEIGSIYGVGPGTVRDFLKKIGIFTDFYKLQKIRLQENEGNVIRDFKNGNSINSLAKKYICSHKKIVKILRINQIPISQFQKVNFTGKIPRDYFFRIRNKAAGRKLDFTITIEVLNQQFEIQNEMCAFSGIKLAFASNGEDRREIQTASLDRIDSSLGYIPGNIQWVHKRINCMKSDLSDSDFINFCKQIAEFRKQG